MSYADFQELAKAPPDRDLGGLERDLWRRVASAAMERRAARLAIAMQIVALAVGSVGSAVFGRSWEVDRVAAEASALAPYTQLAPSSLLIGALR